MNSIEIMVAEHDNILHFNKVIRRACASILDSYDICIDDFKDMIQFARNYADKHHHGKEEQILFKEMVTHLGPIGTNLITHGMLVEHDFGRLFMFELEVALEQYRENPTIDTKLNIISNAIGYTNLLNRHIGKENEVVFTYAENNLSSEIMEDVNERTKVFEAEAEDLGTQKKYLDILNVLDKKYPA